MQHWRLDPQRMNGQIDVARAARLFASIVSTDSNALAAEMLALMGSTTALSHCTVFAYEKGQEPRTVSVADRRGVKYVRGICDLYTRRFYLLDGNHQIVADAGSPSDGSAIMIHRQSQQDIRDAGYRTACYDGPDTSDRLAVLLRPSQSAWLSLNFYRPRTYGCAGPAEIQTLENYAPMFAQAAKAHYRLTMASGGTLEPMLAKLTVASPTLTKRELDVLRGILEGLSREEISLRMGVKVSSVETYQKRAYARLGISRQRQLFALCMLDSSVI